MLLLIIFSRCSILEDRDECWVDNISLQFHYTLNSDDKDLFSKEVDKVVIYAFDGESSFLRDTFSFYKNELVNGSKILSIDEGLYNFVVLGFGDAKTKGVPGDYGYSGVNTTIGETTLDEFEFRLNSKTNENGETIPLVKDFSDLFYSIAPNVPVWGVGKKYVELSLVKNTNLFKIQLNGMGYFNDQTIYKSLDLNITALNDSYNYKNNVKDDSKTITYRSVNLQTVGENLISHILVQKMDKQLHTSNPLFIHIKSAITGDYIIPPVNILEVLAQVKDENDNLLYKTQEDLDKIYEHTFEFTIGVDLTVTIKVDGWEIIYVTGEV